MIEGKVIKEFNDKQNNLKKYTVGKKFKEESQRYNELKSKGFVDEGKEVATKSSEQVVKWLNMIGSSQKKNTY